MRMMLAAIAISMLLLSGAADAQIAKPVSAKPKIPAAGPTVKPTPKVLQAPRIVVPQSKRDTEATAYSDLVDNVSESVDQFREDNTTGNEGRDHLDDAEPEAKGKPRR
ncbi:hypothetical protein [Lysobacter sp. CFH 32150]|uniref:hypothetical protein n=1 Tax=Lysobacter sp. CFH 32150 TaxID=2927128 RepID=UPI001FA7FB3F|nr:hypothetical protein [Lysobacter sp. CFH 32150]MCI4569320.1 hypothetical protein [Lysobacter sp. CFH 32150]